MNVEVKEQSVTCLISVEEFCFSEAKQMMGEELCFELCGVRNGALMVERNGVVTIQLPKPSL